MHVSDITGLCVAGEGKDLQKSMEEKDHAFKYHSEKGGVRYSC